MKRTKTDNSWGNAGGRGKTNKKQIRLECMKVWDDKIRDEINVVCLSRSTFPSP